MRQTHPYTASDYNRDHIFPLFVWLCWPSCRSQQYAATIKEEAAEYHQRNKTKPGVIIGRPAKSSEAYTGMSAIRYQQRSPEQQITTSSSSSSITL
jgi:hypothetical protein